MKIAILGGTGDIGEGLALRLAQKHQIIVGSREAEKAQDAANNYNRLLKEKGLKDDIRGMTNLDATKNSDVVILAVKYQFAIQTIQSVEGVLDGKVVVTPIVPMSKQKLCSYTPPEQGSAAKHICSVMPPEIRTVVAFQTLPAPRLADLNDPLGFDVIVCADDEEAKKLVMGLVSDLGNVRPLDGGGLEEAKLVESLTPLLINLAIKNKMKPLSIKFV
ncbi:F420-dependent NADP reductase [Methanocella paludicola SANAE]|uniref:F420-dependent NADP reductase n=1 Tax=Methanocella paludicola (strain DSM 17711 / JCM 13418 / NBRC 101707 / SANAE) TaxID=304371 RepID=D1YV15_METPS|nr:NADPH-dependent F420 reductase [Methanocella paludicola]BAI60287.1 F420-dependent NADP reductase [Methanocella paludicola SANAE]